ncbi:Exd2 [Symbiodinium microadriaticum]|nr:Exd2 [Symbiodinium microadriaticum]
MPVAKLVHLLLAAVVLRALCDNSCEEAGDNAWLQLRVSNESKPKLPEELQGPADCSHDDMACVARKTACNLAMKTEAQWPLRHAEIASIRDQLKEVCQGHPLDLDLEPQIAPVEETSFAETETNAGKHKHDCQSEFRDCILDVVFYEAKNRGAEHAMKSGKFAAKAASDTLKEVLKDAKTIALKGVIAFAFVGAAISAFFPSAGGLPVNPCTYATNDWAKLAHEDMLGSAALFTVDRAIDTTAGAYLAQFASLHASVMTNLMGSTRWRTKGDRALYQHLLGCYAVRVYERATEAFHARISTLSAEEGEYPGKCCGDFGCYECVLPFGEFKDTWKKPECKWHDGYEMICVNSRCKYRPHSADTARRCYQQHYDEVEKQLVKFWADWLAPVPIWLNNILLMQDIPVNKTDKGLDSQEAKGGPEVYTHTRSSEYNDSRQKHDKGLLDRHATSGLSLSSAEANCATQLIQKRLSLNRLNLCLLPCSVLSMAAVGCGCAVEPRPCKVFQVLFQVLSADFLEWLEIFGPFDEEQAPQEAPAATATASKEAVQNTQRSAKLAASLYLKQKQARESREPQALPGPFDSEGTLGGSALRSRDHTVMKGPSVIGCAVTTQTAPGFAGQDMTGVVTSSLPSFEDPVHVGIRQSICLLSYGHGVEGLHFLEALMQICFWTAVPFFLTARIRGASSFWQQKPAVESRVRAQSLPAAADAKKELVTSAAACLSTGKKFRWSGLGPAPSLLLSQRGIAKLGEGWNRPGAAERKQRLAAKLAISKSQRAEWRLEPFTSNFEHSAVVRLRRTVAHAIVDAPEKPWPERGLALAAAQLQSASASESSQARGPLGMSIASICAAARGEAHQNLEASRCDPAALPKSRLGRLAAFRAQRYGEGQADSRDEGEVGEAGEAGEGPGPEPGWRHWDQPKSRTKPLAPNSLLKPKGGPEIKPSKPAPLPPDVRSRRASEKAAEAAEAAAAEGVARAWSRKEEEPKPQPQRPAERQRERAGGGGGRGRGRGRAGGYGARYGARCGAGRSGQGWKEEPMIIVAAYRGYTRDFELCSCHVTSQVISPVFSCAQWLKESGWKRLRSRRSGGPRKIAMALRAKTPSWDAARESTAPAAWYVWNSDTVWDAPQAPATFWSPHSPQPALLDEPSEVLVVNSTESRSYVALCWDLAMADLVALDVEWVPDVGDSDHPISVMQLAFPTCRAVYVLQLHRIGRIPSPVQQMLVDPWITKVGFGVDCKDVDKFVTSGIPLYRDSVVDMQPPCGELLGAPPNRPCGLRRTALELLRYVLRKDISCSCSDWSVHTLSPQQVKYAALDAWVTLRLFYHAQLKSPPSVVNETSAMKLHPAILLATAPYNSKKLR